MPSLSKRKVSSPPGKDICHTHSVGPEDCLGSYGRVPLEEIIQIGPLNLSKSINDLKEGVTCTFCLLPSDWLLIIGSGGVPLSAQDIVDQSACVTRFCFMSF